jgi:hypothetical protein
MGSALGARFMIMRKDGLDFFDTAQPLGVLAG